MKTHSSTSIMSLNLPLEIDIILLATLVQLEANRVLLISFTEMFACWKAAVFTVAKLFILEADFALI